MYDSSGKAVETILNLAFTFPKTYFDQEMSFSRIKES